MNEERLREYLTAWNDHELDRIVELMTEDCSYHGSAGPESEFLGRSAFGRENVREAIAGFFRNIPDAGFEDVQTFVAGDRGAADWTLVWTDAAGAKQRLRGCDLFEFRGDLVATENAFRKART